MKDFFVQLVHDAGDHDCAQLALIAEEAGALVTDSHGHRWQPGMRELVVANTDLHAKFIAT